MTTATSADPSRYLFHDGDRRHPWWRRRRTIVATAILVVVAVVVLFAFGAFGATGESSRTAVVAAARRGCRVDRRRHHRAHIAGDGRLPDQRHGRVRRCPGRGRGRGGRRAGPARHRRPRTAAPRVGADTRRRVAHPGQRHRRRRVSDWREWHDHARRVDRLRVADPHRPHRDDHRSGARRRPRKPWSTRRQRSTLR